MARIFDLKITSVAVECSLGYDVYYDIVNPNNFATNVATGNPATGIPLFLFQRSNGVRVRVKAPMSTQHSSSSLSSSYFPF